MNGRKIAMVRLSFPALLSIMEHGKEFNNLRCVQGVPSDAVFCNSYFDGQKQEACMVFMHDSFKIVPEGYVMPELKIEHEIDDHEIKWRDKWECLRLFIDKRLKEYKTDASAMGRDEVIQGESVMEEVLSKMIRIESEE